MPKIMRARIVNLTFNESRHISDMTQNMYGENTLITLANGGGKSVMVQAFLQPMIPNSKPGERAVSEWFKKKTTPSYIMHEWLLDESGGRVLTGIGIKRNTNSEGDAIKMVAFISEYSEPGPYDLDNIPLTEKDGNTTRMIDFEDVIQSLSDAEKNPKNKVWMYRVNNYPDKKDHEEKLREYGIDRNEWKSVIEKMNKDEGGLSDMFVEKGKGKTSKKLLDGWIIPNIEENLIVEENRIPNLRQSIKDVAKSIVKNESLIEENNRYNAFKPKVESLLNDVRNYDDINKDIGVTSLEIGTFYSHLKEQLQQNEDEKDGVIYELDRIEDLLTEIDYEKLSFEHYESQKEHDRLEGLLLTLKDKMEEISNRIEELEKRKKVLECARLNDEIKNLTLRIMKNKVALEKETKDNEQIENELKDVNFTLKGKYQEEIEKKEARLNELEEDIKRAETQIAEKKIKLRNTEDSIKKLNNLLNEYSGRIKVFESNENNMFKRYPDFSLGRNVMGEYDNVQLQDYTDGLKKRLAEIIDKIESLDDLLEKNKETVSTLEVEKEETRIQLEKKRIDEAQKRVELERIEIDKENVLDVFVRRDMRSYGLSDRYVAIEKLIYKEKDYQRLIDISKINISNKENELNMYETGKNVSMPEGLEEELGSHGINYHFGFEWLKNYSASEGQKSSLLKNNPFIPYSIILTKRDMAALKGVDLKVFTSTSIPVIERESLEDSFEVAKESNVYVLNGINFLMNFNDKLLNEKEMTLIKESLISSIRGEREEIERLEMKKGLLSADIRMIESFNYTDSDIEGFENELVVVGSAIEKDEEMLKSINVEIRDLISNSDELRNFRVEAKKDEESLNHQIKEVASFIREYEAFLTNSSKLREVNNGITDSDKEIESLKHALEELRSTKDASNLNRRDAINELSGLKKDQLPFLSYEEGKFIDGGFDELLVISKSLESKRSGNIDSIQENINDFTEERSKLLSELNAKDVGEAEYSKVVYTKESLDEILNRIRELGIELNEAMREDGMQQSKFEMEEKILEKKEGEIYNKHSGKAPKSIDAIMGLDFKSRKASCEKDKDEYGDLLDEVEGDIRKLEKIINSMDEYKDFPKKEIKKELSIGELDKYKLDVLKRYRDLQLKEREAKDRLNDKYMNLENQFADKDSLYGDFFKKYLVGHKRFSYQDTRIVTEQMLNALDRRISQMQVVLEQIDRRKDEIVRNAKDHTLSIYDELSRIDSNSAIEIFGRRKKMLELSIPKKEDLMHPLFDGYMRKLIQDSTDIIREHGKKEDELDIYLKKAVDTIPLFDKLIGDDSVKVFVMKVEENKVKRISWEEAMRSNSGGEHFVSTFIVTVTLMNYAGKNNSNNGKVLIMDNPFGKVTSKHLLAPIFMVAEKYNTQLICLSDITLSDIVSKFDVVNAMKVDKSSNGYEFISLDPIIGSEREEYLSLAVFNRSKKKQTATSEQISLI